MDMLVKKVEDRRAMNTLNILQSISYHLSGKEECKGATYRVKIEEWGSYHQYSFVKLENPVGIQIFPSRYHRKFWDKSPVIQHVILKHFSDIFAYSANGDEVTVHTNMVVCGTYEYKPVGRNYRRWFKVD